MCRTLFYRAGGLTASLCPDRRFALFVISGLILGLAGDQLLALRFIYPRKHNTFFAIGGSSFAAGHILYIIALFQNDCPVWMAAIPVGAAGVAASLIFARMMKLRAGVMRIPLIGYILILSAALAVSWGNAAGQLLPNRLIFCRRFPAFSYQ